MLEATQRLVDVALAFLRTVPSRWPDFIVILSNLPPTELERSLDVLAGVNVDAFNDQDHLESWRALVELVGSHRQFPTAAWALPDSVLRRFEEIAARWEPVDSPERHARLFDWHPDLPGTDKFDHAAYEEALTEVRRTVVHTTLEVAGREGL